MTPGRAAIQVRSLLDFIDGHAFETRRPTKEEIGNYADNCYEALWTLVRHAEWSE